MEFCAYIPVNGVDGTFKVRPRGIPKNSNILMRVMQISHHRKPKAKNNQRHGIIPKKVEEWNAGEEEYAPK
jgi:hypothetical protein